MMKKKDVINFFNNCAPHWDDNMVRNDRIIGIILDNAMVEQGKKILDVACGTGVLFSDYLKRDVESIVGVDISPKMTEIAQQKFTQSNITIICGDIEEFEFDKVFDCAVVYNAFPHFPEPEALIKKLSAMVKIGGTVTVAHGMSRKALDRHHCDVADSVSNHLMSEDELADIFSRYLKVTVKISDDDMYQVTGVKEQTDIL